MFEIALKCSCVPYCYLVEMPEEITLRENLNMTEINVRHCRRSLVLNESP